MIKYFTKLDCYFMEMVKSESGSNVGTGGMSAKLIAAQIAMDAGADLVIAKFEDGIVTKILQGEPAGTYFSSGKESV